MKQTPMQIEAAPRATLLAFTPERLFLGFLKKRLRLFEAGSLRLELPTGMTIQHHGTKSGPSAVIQVKRWSLLRKLLAEGEIGLARSFVDGDWTTPDLAAVLEFGLANEASLSSTSGVGIAHFLGRRQHRRNANTPRGSRRNIAAHYDLGNSFYTHWLDGTMTYSSAIYDGPEDTLEQAQERKFQRIVDLLELQGGEEVLEIGCGWGSLATRVAAAGARQVKGITLSTEQAAWARNIAARSDGDIDIEIRDYRTISKRYDRIVSIEMFEAVGEEYWSTFFDQLRRNLTDDGVAVLQIITIAERLFESYRSRPDFIQRYIFPGGMLPTHTAVQSHARNAGFKVERVQAFGESYARTVDDWHRRFIAAWPAIERLGFDDRFRRMWTYYLDYCAVGFRSGSIDVGLYQLRPE